MLTSSAFPFTKIENNNKKIFISKKFTEILINRKTQEKKSREDFERQHEEVSDAKLFNFISKKFH